MNILFANYEYPPLGGGGGVMNAQLAQELAKRHNVTVLTSQGLGLPHEDVVNGVRVLRTPVFFRRQEASANLLSMSAYLPMAIAEGRKLVSHERFDVINTHFVLPTGPVGDALAHFAHLPNVLTLHGGDLYDPSKRMSPHRHAVLRAIVRRLLRRADMVVGQSANTLANMRKYYVPELEGILIPLGIQRPQPSRGERSEYGFSDDDVLLITVGRLVARKAVDQLIRVLDRLADPRTHLIIVGTGPLERALREETQSRQLQGRVHFMGFVDDAEKFRLLGISDIYVSAAQHEGFCLSFLEAMSRRLPVVSYDNGGHTDYLRDGETGFVVPLNDLERFTQRTALLVQDRQLRRRMGMHNLDRVEEYYIDTCACRYESLFEAAIERRRSQVALPLLQSSATCPE